MLRHPVSLKGALLKDRRLKAAIQEAAIQEADSSKTHLFSSLILSKTILLVSMIISNPKPNLEERNANKGNIIKDIRNLFRLKKRKKNVIEDKIIPEIRALLESDEKDCYELIRIGNKFSNNYIEFESKGYRSKAPSIEEYIHKIRLYLSNIINDLKTQGEWKIQLSITISFLFLKILRKNVLRIERVIKE